MGIERVIDTTVHEDDQTEEIIEKSGTSKGSFYHYFEGKDALLGSLSYIFDEEYERLQAEIDEIKGKIADMHNGAVCSGCGAIIETDASFCKKCGNKID